VCALGRSSAKKARSLACERADSARKCNALHDDCNGRSTEGDGLCPTGKVCDLVAACENAAPQSFVAPRSVCSSHGVCVEKPARQSLPAGQVCRPVSASMGCTGSRVERPRVPCGGCIESVSGRDVRRRLRLRVGVCQSCECTRAAQVRSAARTLRRHRLRDAVVHGRRALQTRRLRCRLPRRHLPQGPKPAWPAPAPATQARQSATMTIQVGRRRSQYRAAGQRWLAQPRRHR